MWWGGDYSNKEQTAIYKVYKIMIDHVDGQTDCLTSYGILKIWFFNKDAEDFHFKNT